MVDRCPCRGVRALVLDVGHAIAIGVLRAPGGVHRAPYWRIGALVQEVEDPVSIRVPRASIRCDRRTGRGVRAAVDGIAHAVTVRIGLPQWDHEPDAESESAVLAGDVLVDPQVEPGANGRGQPRAVDLFGAFDGIHTGRYLRPRFIRHAAEGRERESEEAREPQGQGPEYRLRRGRREAHDLLLCLRAPDASREGAKSGPHTEGAGHAIPRERGGLALGGISSRLDGPEERTGGEGDPEGRGAGEAISMEVADDFRCRDATGRVEAEAGLGGQTCRTQRMDREKK